MTFIDLPRNAVQRIQTTSGPGQYGSVSKERNGCAGEFSRSKKVKGDFGMKIGLVGNMNNNNFAIMRYFRDLGVDAHLLLYSNDGKGTLSHFTPEADTWHMEQWAPFIHQTDIPNSYIAALDFPISKVLELWSQLRRITGKLEYSIGAVTQAQIRRAYSGYDRLVASGITPATLGRVDRALDVFYPYSTGVEFFGSLSARERVPIFRQIIYNAVHRQQLRGLSRARCVFSTDRKLTGEVLERAGVPYIQQTIPMVYNREVIPKDPPTGVLADAYCKLRGAGLSVLHHARLMWKRKGSYSDEEHLIYSKNSDWLIHAFADLVVARPSLSPRLFIVEYGPDVEATKRLLEQRGCHESVTWLPKMARRELMWLLGRVSVGVGEFYNIPSMIWGGTGWETLASGKPLLQGFKFKEGEFEDYYGYPEPPILGVNTKEDVLKHLLFVADHPEKAAQIGERARDWFDAYNGIVLAHKWLEFVTNPAASH